MKGMDMIDSIRVWLAGRVIAWATRRHIQHTGGFYLSVNAKFHNQRMIEPKLNCLF